MDTNDLTEKAYKILNISEAVNHIITFEIGCLCGRCKSEDDFLYAVLHFLNDIKEDTDGYIDGWQLHEEIGSTALKSGVSILEEYTRGVLNVPIEKRGVTIDKKDFG
ncbi:MAG: hypothetical protein L6416_06565 [Candidatus Omnitrophica bacterium]|nr:hypothetical protein [Candidatus Omnitrophota bacterium]